MHDKVHIDTPLSDLFPENGEYSRAVEIMGPAGSLRCTLPVTSLAVGSVAQAAASARWLAATRDQKIELNVDTKAVAESFDSYGSLIINGAPITPWAPLSGYFAASDGWVRTHGNYPHHASAIESALGATSKSELAAAISKRSALDIESLIYGHGGCGVAVRTAKEWRELSGSSYDKAPILRLEHLHDRRPLVPDASKLPLSGVKILDLTRVIAGPTATRLLGTLGADVLRVDPPQLPELTDQHIDTGFSKRSALLDFSKASDRAHLDSLLASADVLISGYRPGSLDEFGLNPVELSKSYPDLIVCRVSAWGAHREDHWATRPGFDSLVQAATGVADALATDSDARPGALPVQALDHSIGYLLAATAMSMLASSQAGTADLALAGAAHWLLENPAAPLDMPTKGNENTAPDVTRATLDSSYGRLGFVPLPLLVGKNERLPYTKPPSMYGADLPQWL